MAIAMATAMSGMTPTAAYSLGTAMRGYSHVYNRVSCSC
jgi:hypothetical protein